MREVHIEVYLKYSGFEIHVDASKLVVCAVRAITGKFHVYYAYITYKRQAELGT